MKWMRLGVVVGLAVNVVHAADLKVDLAAMIRTAVDARSQGFSQAEVGLAALLDSGGVQNCPNKCQNLLNMQAYQINAASSNTYEYVACLAGCDICSQILANNDTLTSCFSECKNTNWNDAVDANGNPVTITKGVLEPDKACIFGCIINLCQEVCLGGTTDNTPSPTNMPAWWGNGGCSIKTGSTRPGGYYSQNSQYNYANSPQGSGGQDNCCAQAFSLCNYDTSLPNYKNSQNYQAVLGQAQTWCANVPGAGQTQKSICAWFNVPANCGNNQISG